MSVLGWMQDIPPRLWFEWFRELVKATSFGGAARVYGRYSKIYNPLAYDTASPLELPALCHWLATGTSSHIACRRCWGIFEFRGEWPPHVQASTSNSFPIGSVLWKKSFYKYWSSQWKSDHHLVLLLQWPVEVYPIHKLEIGCPVDSSCDIWIETG